MNSVVILTGAASGIGLHLAGVFASRGYPLLVTDIHEQILQEQAEKLHWRSPQVLIQKLDVRDREQWKQTIDLAVQTWGRVDILMNIAAYLRPGFIHEIDASEVDRHIDVNIKGVLYGTQAAARQMILQGKGHIINISSLAGIAPTPGISLYSASKFSVRGFSLAVADELRPHGVYVTVVCPDAVQTPMLDLQLGYRKETALVFSGPHPLRVQDIERAIFEKVIPKRPLEVLLPAHRGWLAKLANLFPSLLKTLGPIFRKRGLSNQTKYERGEL
ncbi:MAG: SDR family oxidoreductase [Deltaproteobacteria bacterium]|nr:SDR family oxidoreductase [Deltaproteobacteria bacterium]